MKPTLKALLEAWLVNVGRPNNETEAREFVHAFESADLALLRTALDDFFAAAPEYPKLPGLRAVYSRLAAAKNVGQADAKARERALDWLKYGGPEKLGFVGTGATVGAAELVREKMLAHYDAQLDADKDRMFRLENEIARLGFQLVPERGEAIYARVEALLARSEEASAKWESARAAFKAIGGDMAAWTAPEFEKRRATLLAQAHALALKAVGGA